MKTYIFGARATAVGLYKALSVLEPEKKVDAFLVSERNGNPEEIWGCPVMLMDEAVSTLKEEEKKDTVVYVAVPELIHDKVQILLNEKGFSNLQMLDSRKEAYMMEQFYEKVGLFSSVHSLPIEEIGNVLNLPKLTVYAAAFYKDKALNCQPIFPEYVRKLYVGCDKARKLGIDISGKADFYDDMGENISVKNPIYCEMTAHYWIWKNRMDTNDEYVGVCHYRRMLDISDADLRRMKEHDVDVVLPFPMFHFPDAGIHHTWYLSDKDWNTMRQVLKELYPEYEVKYEEVFGQPYFYNYNMMIAKKEVFADYCAWVYPILERIEKISNMNHIDREDRYMGYICENLMTLYFGYHKDDLKIYHTGRLLFT